MQHRVGVLGAWLAVGCGARRPVVLGPADCERAVARVVDLASAEVEVSDADDIAIRSRFLEPVRATLLGRCAATPWSQEHRACLAAAADLAALHVCDREAASTQVDLGGPSCAEVADHLAVVAVRAEDPGHAADLRARMELECAGLTRSIKECVLAATTFESVLACGAD